MSVPTLCLVLGEETSLLQLKANPASCSLDAANSLAPQWFISSISLLTSSASLFQLFLSPKTLIGPHSNYSSLSLSFFFIDIF